MRKLLFILSLFVAGLAHARVLHVDDNVIKLSQTKTTDPALHVRVGDELWYGNMVRCTLPMNENTDKELKVRYNDKIYNVIEPFTDTTTYTYDENGRLIAANENIYLENTRTQWVDTGFIANQDTSVEGKFWSNDIDFGFFGARETLYKNTYGFICTAAGIYRTDYNTKVAEDLHSCIQNKTFTVYKNKNITSVFDDSDVKVGYTETVYAPFETPVSLYLLGFHLLTPVNLVSRPGAKNRAYYMKIWDNDVLVRHFVPVPCGLKIGDFVVPSNGMWDIVEQKFYGNMGTGDFIYGVDE